MRKDFIERQLTPEVLGAALEALASQWAEAVAEVERLKKQLDEQFHRHQQERAAWKVQYPPAPDLIDE